MGIKIKRREIQLADVKLDLEPDEGDTLIGTLRLLGGYFHVFAIRVTTKNGLQVPTDDPEDRFGDLERGDIADGHYQTVKIHGFKGSFVLHIVPFCD